MRCAIPICLVLGALALSGCEKKFDEKFDDNLAELKSEADEIKAQADAQLAAGREAEKADRQAQQSEDQAE